MIEKRPEMFKKPEKTKSEKLTPEEAKRMAKEFVEKRGGLLPEFFGLPGEEKEGEREYPEELLVWYEVKKEIKEKEKLFTDVHFWEFMIQKMLSYFREDTPPKEEVRRWLENYSLLEELWWTQTRLLLEGYHLLISHHQYQRIKEELADTAKQYIKKIEEIFKDDYRLEIIIEKILSDLKWANTPELEVSRHTLPPRTVVDILREYHIEFPQITAEVFKTYHLLLSLPRYQEIKKEEKFSEKIQQIEERFKEENVRKNMINTVLSFVQFFHQEKGNYYLNSRMIFETYHLLLSHPQYQEIKQQFQKEIKQIEEVFKNELLWKTMIEGSFPKIPKKEYESPDLKAFAAYHYFLSILPRLYEIGEKKMIQREYQKAIQAKKKLPSIPEEKGF